MGDQKKTKPLYWALAAAAALVTGAGLARFLTPAPEYASVEGPVLKAGDGWGTYSLNCDQRRFSFTIWDRQYTLRAEFDFANSQRRVYDFERTVDEGQRKGSVTETRDFKGMEESLALGILAQACERKDPKVLRKAASALQRNFT